MCSVSMVGDHYRDLWKNRNWYPDPAPMSGSWTISAPQVSRAEFEDLKRQVLEMKELLKRAKAYDEKNGEPDCEIDDKMDLLRKIAKVVGVDLDDVLLRANVPFVAKFEPAPVDPMEAVREISRGDL